MGETLQTQDAKTQSLEDIDPSLPERFRDDVWHEWFARLRKEDPVHYCKDSVNGAYWSVTNHADIKAVDTNHEVFSSEAGGIAIVDPLEGEQGIENFIAMDPPRHDEQRRTVTPSVAPTKTESPFLATKTCFNLSPSSKAIALFPFLLMLENSFAETFLITPLSVIMTRKVSSSSSPSCGSFGVFFFIKAEGSKLKMAVIDSPLSMSTNLVNGVPCAVVDASGMSKALTVKTFPLSVKKKTRSKSFACITFAMESDPFNFDIDFSNFALSLPNRTV